MRMRSQWTAVLATEWRRILRDPFLIFMIIAPFVFAIVLRYLLPYLETTRFAATLNLRGNLPLITSLFSVAPALYLGGIFALNIVEEKDDNCLAAVAVTPFSMRGYFFMRMWVYALAAVIVILAVHYIIGLVYVPPAKMLAVAALSAFQVPLLALLTAGTAENQVEAVVRLKGTSIFLLPVLAMYFVPDYWHVFCAVLPPYWPIMGYFQAARHPTAQWFFWTLVVFGIAIQIVIVRVMFRRFRSHLLVMS
jgi:fluoroquinolone transport system permease protein